MDDQKTINELVESLGDWRWRLNNLYFVRNEKGQKVLFKMNETQQEVADNMWYLNIIPKARQLGMTTFWCLFYLDQVLFSNDKVAGIIAHREEDMKKIFRNKILYALEHLRPEVKAYIGAPVIETANEIVFDNGGSIFVSLSTRGGTVNFLHISEFGYICAHAPEKADEILNGAINSVHAGQMVSIESTAAGRTGHFYRLVTEAEKMKKEGRHLTPLDFKIMFFPWWKDKRYFLVDEDAKETIIDSELKKYFEELEFKHGIHLTTNQQAWYSKKKAMLGDGMYSEFPSHLDEAFMEALEGAYYTNEMAKVYQEKRIGFYPFDKTAEVNTSWDLGMNDHNTIVFYQEIGPEIRVIDYYENSGFGLDHYVQVLRERASANGYRYGRHNLPHDATVRDLSAVGGITRQQVLWDLGLTNTMIVPKIGIQDGIEKVRQIFSRLRFNETTTKLLTDYIANYRRDYDKKAGVWKNLPKHGPESHACFTYSTPVLMADGSSKNIGDIVTGDCVQSPFGPSRVLNQKKTGVEYVYPFKGLTVTSNHPFLTKRGFVPLDALRVDDSLVIWQNKKLKSRTLNLMGLSLDDIQIQKLGLTVFTFKLLERTIQVKIKSGYIDIFLKNIRDRFLLVGIFITKMVIQTITIYQICKLLAQKNIQKNMLTLPQQQEGELYILPLQKLLNGTDQKKDSDGTVNTVKKHGKVKRRQKKYADIVKRNIRRIFQQDQNGVLLDAGLQQHGIEKKEVYNITTEHGMYIVGGGFVVSNCDALRGLAISYTESGFLPEGVDAEKGVNIQSFAF